MVRDPSVVPHEDLQAPQAEARGAGREGSLVMRKRRKSGFPPASNSAQTLALSSPRLGYSCPQRYPYPEDALALGEPLTIGQAAHLIGCSPWTVRQTLIPSGLPVFRSRGSGKLIFYRDQVVRWITSRQGGNA